MKPIKRLFLQGDIHTGKTSIILRQLKPYINDADGFTVKRVVENGECKAFYIGHISNAWKETRICADESSVFLKKTEGVWREDISVFVKFASEYLLNGLGKTRLVVIDEIGGIELRSDVFMDVLRRVFTSGIACLGVLKSENNLKLLGSSLKIEKELFARRNAIQKLIMLQEEGEVIVLNEQNAADTEMKIGCFLKRLMESSNNKL